MEMLMPVLVNYDSIKKEQVSDGFYVQSLVNPERVGSDCILLDRWELDPGAVTKIEMGDKDLSWFQLLKGTAVLNGDNGDVLLTTDHVVFLPPSFKAQLASTSGCVVLVGTIPKADRYDDTFSPEKLAFRCVNWKEEPALDSQHDKRKRIYLVTPTLFGTKAIKGEMIIYAPGTKASNHHHEGAEHFQYIISGTATALLNGEPHKIREGDTLYNYEFEKHNFINDDHEDLVFVEYFVPAECRTIWADDDPVCTWIPSGKNIDGGEPSREIAAHSSAETTNPDGV
jgi:quercetin dioxygenase-like cupin family protein